MRGILKKLNKFLHPDPESDSVEYWKLSSYDNRVQDYSHWCGASTRWDSARWIEYGRGNVGFAMRSITGIIGPSFLEAARRGRALEWGCGGGANVIALYDYFEQVVGLEIAAPTLEECGKQVAARGRTGFQGLLIEKGRPESALREVRPGSIDFAISIEVFQHFPSKDYALRVMNIMCKLLKDGAPAWIQVRDDDGSRRLRQKDSDYAANMIYMSSFTPEEFIGLAAQSGFQLLWHGNDPSFPNDDHAYYLLQKAFPLTK